MVSFSSVKSRLVAVSLIFSLVLVSSYLGRKLIFSLVLVRGRTMKLLLVNNFSLVIVHLRKVIQEIKLKGMNTIVCTLYL